MQQGIIKTTSIIKLVTGIEVVIENMLFIIREIIDDDTCYVNRVDYFEDDFSEISDYTINGFKWGEPLQFSVKKDKIKLLILESFPDKQQKIYLDKDQWETVIQNNWVDNESILFYQNTYKSRSIENHFGSYQFARVGVSFDEFPIKSDMVNICGFDITVFEDDEYITGRHGKSGYSYGIIQKKVANFIYQVIMKKEPNFYLDKYDELLNDIDCWFKIKKV